MVAAEADAACVDVIFRSLEGSAEGAKIVPLVLDITNPSPALGWRLKERPSLSERLSTDYFLALALIHHLCIARNIPLDQFVDSLASFGRAGVVEWVDKSDDMVVRMLRNRRDVFEDYDRETFEAWPRATFPDREPAGEPRRQALPLPGDRCCVTADPTLT